MLHCTAKQQGCRSLELKLLFQNHASVRQNTKLHHLLSRQLNWVNFQFASREKQEAITKVKNQNQTQ